MEEQVASSAVPPQVPQQPPMPNFEEMRRIAMQQAIEQITSQRPPAPQPAVSQAPEPQYISPPPLPPFLLLPKNKNRCKCAWVRRNLTRPELLAVFVVACIAVTGVCKQCGTLPQISCHALRLELINSTYN